MYMWIDPFLFNTDYIAKIEFTKTSIRLSTDIKFNFFSIEIFQLQQGIAIIPKTVTPSRLKENMNIFDFSLTNEEMASIAKLGTHQRVARFAE